MSLGEWCFHQGRFWDSVAFIRAGFGRVSRSSGAFLDEFGQVMRSSSAFWVSLGESCVHQERVWVSVVFIKGRVWVSFTFNRIVLRRVSRSSRACLGKFRIHH